MSEQPIKASDNALELMKQRGLGALADKMGIELLELSAERAVATMPVAGNTQPIGLLHGGAHVVLAESLGSFAANVHAHPWGYAVGFVVATAALHASGYALVRLLPQAAEPVVRVLGAASAVTGAWLLTG